MIISRIEKNERENHPLIITFKKEYLKDFQAVESGDVLLILHEGDTIYSALSFYFPSVDSGNHLNLTEIRSIVKKKGYAKKIIKVLLKIAKNEYKCGIDLLCAESNIEARRLFEKFGFVKYLNDYSKINYENIDICEMDLV